MKQASGDILKNIFQMNILGYAIFYLIFFGYTITLPSIIETFNISSRSAHLSNILFLYSSFLSVFFSGFLKSIFNYKKSILLNVTIYILASLLFFLGPISSIFIYLACFFMGLGIGSIPGFVGSILNDYMSYKEISQKHKVNIQTSIYILISFMPIASQYTCSLILKYAGLNINFLLFGITGILFLVYTFLKFEEFNTDYIVSKDKVSSELFFKIKTLLLNYKNLLSNPSFIVMLLPPSLFFGSISFYLCASTISFSQEFDKSLMQISTYTLLIYSANTIGQACYKLISNNQNIEKNIIMIASIIAIFGNCGMLFLHFKNHMSPLFITITMLFTSYSYGLIQTKSTLCLLNLAPNNKVNASSLFGMSKLLLSTLLNFILSFFHHNILYYSSITLLIISIMIFFISWTQKSILQNQSI